MYHDVKNLHNVLLLSVYCSCLSANYGCLYYQYTIYLQLSLSVVSFISIHELSTCSCLCHLLTKSTAAVFINLLQLSLSICCSCLCQSTAAVFVKLLQLSLSVYCSCLYQCTAVVSFISILSTYSCPCPSTYEICCTCLCQSIAAVLQSIAAVLQSIAAVFISCFCRPLQLSLSVYCSCFVVHCSCLYQYTAAVLQSTAAALQFTAAVFVNVLQLLCSLLQLSLSIYCSCVITVDCSRLFFCHYLRNLYSFPAERDCFLPVPFCVGCGGQGRSHKV